MFPLPFNTRRQIGATVAAGTGVAAFGHLKVGIATTLVRDGKTGTVLASDFLPIMFVGTEMNVVWMKAAVKIIEEEREARITVVVEQVALKKRTRGGSLIWETRIVGVALLVVHPLVQSNTGTLSRSCTEFTTAA